jgi:hypothetical protein
MSDRPTAEAVAAALQEHFRERRERGHWFRATPDEVRRAITERSIIGLYRTAEARERAAAREAAAAAKAEAASALAAASAAERRRLRREQRAAAARMLASGMTFFLAKDALHRPMPFRDRSPGFRLWKAVYGRAGADVALTFCNACPAPPGELAALEA